MSTKLSTITTQYRRFTKNQVLTEGHLNEIVDFFDDQDRLTRICLSGVGIVCGFEVSYLETTKTISITQGSGITTDGDLFHLYQTNDSGGKTIDFESKQYTHFKVYDNTKASYKPFFYNGNEQLKIYELLTAEQQASENNETFPIAILKAKTGIEIQEAVTLLYLESYEKELDLCVSLSCDNQGLEIVGNHRVLLVSKEVAIQINSHDTIISQTNYSNLYHKLPDVFANRIVLNPENFVHYKEIKKSFTNGIYKNNVVNRLRNGFQILLTNLQMPVLLGSIQNNLNSLFNFNENNAPSDFQYRYDLLKDLIDTYNEIKLLLFDMDVSFCCPNRSAFPKHLMLGEIVKAGPCFEYRHAFYKSPLLTDQNLTTCNDCITFDDLIEVVPQNTAPEFIIDIEGIEIDICYGKNTDQQKLYSLIKRCVQLLANYNPNYNYIKITPSFQLGSLGKKAIPFYNNVGNHIIQLWDFDKTVLGQQRDNISYHDALLNTKRPLEISLDNNFYRIEGHQGRNYKEALKIIQDSRRKNGLGFNVVVLGVNALEIEDTIDNYTSFYLNKNHGYEHKAGVAPGGTFVMIYIQGEYDPYYYGYEYARGNSLAGDFENALEVEPMVLNPIVADFALPYMCCDENFITLTLPINRLCFDEKTPYFPFHVTPNGGFVKADVDDDLNGGVTRNQYGEFVFDPKLVSDELIGKTISFTVNNIDTECKVTIFRKPKFDFTVVTNAETGATSVIAHFTIVSENSNGNKYTWNFGDDSENSTTTETQIEHTYQFESEGVYTFTVTVLGDNGNCSLQVQHTVTIEIIKPTISIDTQRICRNDTTAHFFTIQPEDAVVEITGEGVSRIDGKFVFIGANVGTDTSSVLIFVNGVASDLEIIIVNPPTAIFTHAIDTDSLVLSNNSVDAERYIWDVAGEIIERNIRSQIRRPLSNYTGTSIQVSLTAVNELCGQSVDGPRSITIRDAIPVNTCLDNATIFIQKSISDVAKLKDFVTSNPRLFSKETISLIQIIETQLAQINKNRSNFINGSNNNLLLDIFATEQITNLIVVIIRTRETPEQEVAISLLFEIHLSLFYTLLKCQEQDKLKEFEAQITTINDLFDFIFKNFIELQFDIDKDQTLKEFLTGVLPVFEKVLFILNGIKTQLDNLLLLSGQV
jgi:hypothetical protein